MSEAVAKSSVVESPCWLLFMNVKSEPGESDEGTPYFMQTYDGMPFDGTKNYWQVYCAAEVKTVGYSLVRRCFGCFVIVIR